MKRKSDLIKRLLKSDRPVNVSMLSSCLNVSSKTIRNDLAELEHEFDEYDLKLVRRPGVGVYIEGDTADKNRLYLSLAKTDVEELSPLNRQSEILLKLFRDDKPMMIKELSMDFYVSRTTIANDIVEINHKLLPFDMKIEYRKGLGIVIEGSEVNKRKALSKLFPTSQAKAEYPIYPGVSDRSTAFLVKFKEVLNLDYDRIEQILHESEKDLGFEFTSEALTNLAIHLAIAIRRMMQGNEIVLTHELIENLDTHKELEVSRKIADRIDAEFNVTLSNNETYYILLHILSAKRTRDKNSDLPFRLNSSIPSMEEFVKTFIHNIQVELQIFLESDDAFFNYLLLHLKPTITRLKFGLAVENPLFTEIMENYPMEFEAVKHQKPLFKGIFGIDLPDHEIAYLVLHVAAARERNMAPIKVLVVCASGIGTSQLLVAKLKRLFSNLDIIDVISNADVTRYEDASIDLVISTIRLSTTLRTIVVSPILDELDLSQLRSWLEGEPKPKQIKLDFSEEDVHLHMELKSKKELLEFLCENLRRRNDVEDSYLSSLWERESIGSTMVAAGLAIPHGRFDAVKRSCIQVVTLAQPIEWNQDEFVEVIINVVATRQDAGLFATMFRNLTYKIDDPDFVTNLAQATERKSVYEIVKKELIYEV